MEDWQDIRVFTAITIYHTHIKEKENDNFGCDPSCDNERKTQPSTDHTIVNMENYVLRFAWKSEGIAMQYLQRS